MSILNKTHGFPFKGVLLGALLVGLPFLIIGVSEVIEARQMVADFSETQGTVVENQWEAFAHGGAAYVPRVEFRTQDGERKWFTDGVGSIPPDYEVGEQVTVLYDPQGEQAPRIKSFKRIWFAPLLIASIGLLPVLVVAIVGVGIMLSVHLRHHR